MCNLYSSLNTVKSDFTEGFLFLKKINVYWPLGSKTLCLTGSALLRIPLPGHSPIRGAYCQRTRTNIVGQRFRVGMLVVARGVRTFAALSEAWY